MSCRHCQDIERFFKGNMAKRELRRYRKKGPTGTTRQLIEAVRAEGVEGETLLDIGGGIGAIQHELLAAGAASAVSVDAATAYLDAAREESERRGQTDRVTQLHGDFVELAPEIPPADIVTLDRVICCYPDMPTLVRVSAARATRLYGLTFPREKIPVKLLLALVNLYLRLRGSAFRAYVHPVGEVERAVREGGLEERFRGRAGYVWHVAVYVRSG
jgi:Methyltransferase domain